MPTVVYMANQFPSPVEPYVMDEIRELRRRGVTVVPCSARLPVLCLDPELKAFQTETTYLFPVQFVLGLRAMWLCIRRVSGLSDFIRRALTRGNEPIHRRVRALFHIWLGAYCAVKLQGLNVEHIHVHHGYFGSWIAMVAVRLLGVGFSMTLHGSDLLIDPHFLDVKLQNCDFCFTISEFNRRHMLDRYTGIAPEKILVQCLGVASSPLAQTQIQSERFSLLAVGRLHPVKNYEFLLCACHELKRRGFNFSCRIAGEGPERRKIERLIGEFDLQVEVTLAGHLSAEELDICYRIADLVVLTSHSEGIPLVLMQAMVRGKPVLAPNITGIPELVVEGHTGFLYRAGSLDDFVRQIEVVHTSLPVLGSLREAARQHVLQHFHRDKNLAHFATTFLDRISHHHSRATEAHRLENPLLQQI